VPLSEVAGDIVDVATRVALIGSVGGAATLIALRITGRKSRLLAVFAFGLVGLLFGTTILGSAGQPTVRAVLLVGLLTMFLLSVQVRHQEWGGTALVVAGLPAALVGIAGVVDMNARFGLSAALQVVGPLATGLIAILFGAMFVDGAAASARKLAEPSGDRPWSAASTAVLGPTWFGFNRAAWVAMMGSTAAVLVAVGLASGRGAVDTTVAVIVGGTVSALVTSALWAVAWPAEDRMAFEGFGWLGETEIRRIRRLTGPISFSKEGLLRYIRNTTERPDDRWFRAEILAIDGQLDLAREVAERTPLDTPLAPVDRAANLAYIDWLGGGPGDTAELRAVVAALPAGSDERLMGEGALALMQVRRLVGSHDQDPAAPMREFRQLVGGRADRQMWVTARRGLPGQFRVAVAMIAILTIADHALTG
jgi:hypothetical protein